MDIEPIIISSDDGSIAVTHTRLEHADTLGAMQRLAYPTLADEELLTPDMYRHHLELFPEGQFVALLGGEVPVGSTSTFRTHFDEANLDFYRNQTFYEAIDGGWFNANIPDGQWMYGADVQVHPDYRGRGIARLLYSARKEACRRLNLRGQVAVGMFPGFINYAEQYSMDEYVAKVIASELFDPTLSVQLRQGFRYVVTVYNYLNDPSSGNGSALIVWDNPDYKG